MSDDPRALLRELLAEVLGTDGNGHHAAGSGASAGSGPVGAAGAGGPAGSAGSAGPAPVPAPPTAAVLRPSTWDRPAAPGEVIGDGATPARSHDAPAEVVSLATDAELDRFVRALAARCENPRERAALRSGAVRFTLGGSAGTMRIESGAVTEKTIREAAANGARLVLAPRAVMTPLARERARALKVEVERERRC